ncbi:ribonuclease III [Laetiporus sulphureus 93-53]|uniref:Ribonuclease III n=1 Tax=Laetiporus sulphureus 93-53 TaxID=1314785 RepID=A0A165C8Z2_9APHY|nr:ribonuclease III [Laetiporus sulphureus 93-53]KZT02407.1 ribonuclease III [Laetiporus sulphureus 93-53]
MVKAQVKGLSMQSETHQWLAPSQEGTWPSSAGSADSSIARTGSQAPNLKRPRPSSTNMDAPPPAPKLRGDIILEVFTHKSLRFPGAPTNEESEYGDNERLSVLGEKVLETAVTFTLFNKKPMIKAQEIESQRMEVLSDANYNNWVINYKLREKVRCSPDAVATLTNPKETNLLFCSYVGAVYVQNGMETVQNWIGQLIDPEYEPPVPAADGEPYTYKRVKTEPMSSPTPPPTMHQPPPPMAPPPPLPINPLAPAQPQAAFLPLFNQTANQRRLAVEYPAQFSGPAHAGRWTVQCVVNGIPKGEGSGASKQLAKEEAARQAYYSMGWAPRECPATPTSDVQ